MSLVYIHTTYYGIKSELCYFLVYQGILMFGFLGGEMILFRAR